MDPQFQHDCETCTFLGHYNEHDLYHCKSTAPTVIARRSDDPPDYSSGLMFAGLMFAEHAMVGNALYPLRVAYLIARDRGLP